MQYAAAGVTIDLSQVTDFAIRFVDQDQLIGFERVDQMTFFPDSSGQLGRQDECSPFISIDDIGAPVQPSVRGESLLPERRRHRDNTQSLSVGH